MTRNLHRDDVRKFGVGVVTIAVGGAIAWVGMTVQTGGELPARSYTEVQAVFADAGTLKKQQKVTQDGVRVGIVTDIEYVEGDALVTMRLDGEHALHADATARIGNESALGKKLVEIDPGTEAAGDLDGAIPDEQTVDATSLDDVFAAFPEESRAGLATGVQNLGGGLLGHGQDLQDVTTVAPDLLADTQVLGAALNDPATDLDGLLVSADRLATSFVGREDQLAGLLDGAATTLEAVAVDGGAPLDETLQRAPETLVTAREGLAAVHEPIGQVADAAAALRPSVDEIVAAVPDLRGFLTESPPVAQTVQQFTREAEPAVRALVPAVADLRPVVTRLGRTLALTDPFLTELAPYVPDAGRLFSLHDLLSGNYGPDKHYFSAQLSFPGLHTLSLPDPLADVDAYPGAGQAWGRSYDD